MINKEQFLSVVIKSVQKETSMFPDRWSVKNPTLGHCSVVALIAQDIYGGDLLRASLEGTEFAYGLSHYWNLLPDGSEIDFTEGQFEGRKPQLNGELRTREYVLSNDLTRQRYELLKNAILTKLSQVFDA